MSQGRPLSMQWGPFVLGDTSPRLLWAKAATYWPCRQGKDQWRKANKIIIGSKHYNVSKVFTLLSLYWSMHQLCGTPTLRKTFWALRLLLYRGEQLDLFWTTTNAHPVYQKCCWIWNGPHCKREEQCAHLAMLYSHKQHSISEMQQPLNPYKARRGHDEQHSRIPCRTVQINMLFFPRTIGERNLLNSETVHSPSADAFIARVSAEL